MGRGWKGEGETKDGMKKPTQFEEEPTGGIIFQYALEIFGRPI